MSVGHMTLPAVIAHWAQSSPGRPAIKHVDGTVLSYEQFHRRNLAYAGAFAAMGVSSGDMVLTMMPNSVETYSAWLGLAWLRAIEVPLNVAYKGPMLTYAINYSRAKILAISAGFLECLAPVASALEHLHTVVVIDSDDAESASLPFRLVGQSKFMASVPLREGEPPHLWDTVAMIYTSGTTGPSKGVLVPWGQMHYSNDPAPDLLTSESSYYSFLPTYHMSGRFALYRPISVGSCLALRPHFSASAFWEDVRRFNSRLCTLLPPHQRYILGQPELPDDADNPLYGFWTAPATQDTLNFCARFNVRFQTGFGMTEIGGPLGTDYMPEDIRSSGRVRPGPPYYEVLVVDEHDNELPNGELGELVVRSRMPWALNSGYYGLPDQTAAAWRNGYFHSGDGFTRDERGEFFFVDRMKDYIRSRGENISSFEVERFVARMPEVAEVAAFGVSSEVGEDDVKVCVVLRPGVEMREAELHLALSASMPRFMLPRYVELMESLPRTDATGRVKKVDLKANARNDKTWDSQAMVGTD